MLESCMIAFSRVEAHNRAYISIYQQISNDTRLITDVRICIRDQWDPGYVYAVYVYVYEGAFVFTQPCFGTGNGAIPGRFAAELVFNSESFKRYRAQGNYLFCGLRQHRNWGIITVQRVGGMKGVRNRCVPLADIYRKK